MARSDKDDLISLIKKMTRALKSRLPSRYYRFEIL